MTFTPDIYELIRQGCINSARQVVPTLYDIFKPQSVVDVGGGEGWWGKQFALLGVKSVTVMDDSISLPSTEGDSVMFLPLDLEGESIPKLGFLGYDMALCLEVAEHLEGAAADALVEQLCAVAPVVVFSAAIPGQGGHGHVNEQWPHYWYEKFQAHGFECYDFLRWRFWSNAQVEPWYAQNLLVYSNDGGGVWVDPLITYEDDDEMMRIGKPLSVVHPAIFENHVVPADWICQECCRGWITKPTPDNTVGCPVCGVRSAT